jgi:hypothetical protein
MPVRSGLTEAEIAAGEAAVALGRAQFEARKQQPDHSGLLANAATLRARHTDPADPQFGDGKGGFRADRVATSERELAALLLRAGAVAPVETVQSVAERQHAGQWTQTELNPNLAALVNERVAAIPEHEITERSAALRAELGDAEYARLVADAEHVGLPPAARADKFALKTLAAHGRYKRGAAAARAKF